MAFKLKKYTSWWWENLKKKKVYKGINKIKSYEKMKMGHKKRFYQPKTFFKFHNLRRSRLTIEEYTMEFELLMLNCDIVMLKEQTIALYLDELKEKNFIMVWLQPYWTFNIRENLLCMSKNN